MKKYYIQYIPSFGAAPPPVTEFEVWSVLNTEESKRYFKAFIKFDGDISQFPEDLLGNKTAYVDLDTAKKFTEKVNADTSYHAYYFEVK